MDEETVFGKSNDGVVGRADIGSSVDETKDAPYDHNWGKDDVSGNDHQECATVAPVLFDRPMPATLYPDPVSCLRLTHSDIMCKTITATLDDIGRLGTDDGSQKALPASYRCRLPYNERRQMEGRVANAYGNSEVGAPSSLLEREQRRKARQRLNKELVEERDAFMENLRRERDFRTKVETDAAVIVQRVARGFKVREERGLIKEFYLPTPFKYSDEDITRILLEQTVKLGFCSSSKKSLFKYNDLHLYPF